MSASVNDPIMHRADASLRGASVHRSVPPRASPTTYEPEQSVCEGTSHPDDPWYRRSLKLIAAAAKDSGEFRVTLRKHFGQFRGPMSPVRTSAECRTTVAITGNSIFNCFNLGQAHSGRLLWPVASKGRSVSWTLIRIEHHTDPENSFWLLVLPIRVHHSVDKHDHSFSREDYMMKYNKDSNDNLNFNATIFDTSLDGQKGCSHMTYAQTNEIRLQRESLASQIGFIFAVMGDLGLLDSESEPLVRVNWWEYWFANEALSYELGWHRPKPARDMDFDTSTDNFDTNDWFSDDLFTAGGANNTDWEAILNDNNNPVDPSVTSSDLAELDLAEDRHLGAAGHALRRSTEWEELAEDARLRQRYDGHEKRTNKLE
ncbi:hypothetical protein CERZMDRAFT_104805 [Cercospora zeae-maydis SCOH1-5]|uniref:Heme haloperoxidase family profile domain-containing protein n=1 Tax=Cercospora zeae-maydis SCOH1-5 TaxID=717836 RepID=A0A6A6FSX6_9PEZI|nr:hypothetical protein CERZMDRAFT_104805 [Cercospora zeae-maydis SCOH1-5]